MATAERPGRRVFVLSGAARALGGCRTPEVLLSGPAGTGKSLACLLKMHYLASHTPGFRGLICRKTRESLTESSLVTFERDILGPHHPMSAGASRENRRSYRYPNGAEIIVGGLTQSRHDNRQKLFSTDYDAVYVPEAIELSEEDWENLTTRLRNNRLPYQQIMADTNPDRPTHWLRRRCSSGRTVLLESRHEDNPTLWDRAAGRWTPKGVAYIARLDALTGARKDRLRHGRWVQAEGVVYDQWDAALHLVEPFPIPGHWPRLWSVDFGYTNPFVWQAWAVDDDGRLYLYREIYRTQTLVEDHAKLIRELTDGEPLPVAVVCDHDAEDRATLERHLGLPTVAAAKAVSGGIQAVQARLRKAGDGRPRLCIMRDALVSRDPQLVEAKRPTCTHEEMDSYIWDTRQGRTKEAPVKQDDHGADSMRYLVYTLDGGGGAAGDSASTTFDRVRV